MPLVVAVVAMVARRPHACTARTARCPRSAGTRCCSASRTPPRGLASKVMDRTLPLAALLEMSLQFPERAPSRLGMAQRGGSAAGAGPAGDHPPDESAQEAAERILKLLSALSAHDRFTRGHAERVRAYTDLIAEKMGLPQADRERLRWAALLHDIGKLRVPRRAAQQAGQADRAASGTCCASTRRWARSSPARCCPGCARWSG